MEKAMKGLSSSRTTHSWMACVCATSFPKKQERAVAINRRWRSRSKSSFCTIKPTLTQSVDIITTRPLTYTYIRTFTSSFSFVPAKRTDFLINTKFHVLIRNDDVGRQRRSLETSSLIISSIKRPTVICLRPVTA